MYVCMYVCVAGAEVYAGTVRVILWSRNQLDSLQQDMTIKNFLFISSIYGAYSMWMSVKERYWNDRDLGFGFQLPSRAFQLSFFRFGFAVFYVLQGILFSIILTKVSSQGANWVANIGIDIVLVLIFLVYCKNVHIQSGSAVPRMFFLPQDSFVLFPAMQGAIDVVVVLLRLLWWLLWWCCCVGGVIVAIIVVFLIPLNVALF